MKFGLILIAGIALGACSNNSSGANNLNDSLGNKTTDTMHGGDTAYYERMNQKTGAQDTGSSSISKPRQSDTAYYERMPGKPPDSTR